MVHIFFTQNFVLFSNPGSKIRVSIEKILVNLKMTLKIDFKIKFKVINCLPLNPTTFVRVIFRYHLYFRSYLRGWIKMVHPVYIKQS